MLTQEPNEAEQPPLQKHSDLAKLKGVSPEITYTWESFERGAQEALPLMRKHFAEVYDFQEEFGFDPQWWFYFKLERDGCLHILAVRSAGTLIGYLGVVILPMMHTQKCLRAKGDSFYLDPAYRGGPIFMRMIKHAEARMRELGVSRIEWTSKRAPKKDSGPIFERLGYKCVEYSYAKILK